MMEVVPIIHTSIYVETDFTRPAIYTFNSNRTLNSLINSRRRIIYVFSVIHRLCT